MERYTEQKLQELAQYYIDRYTFINMNLLVENYIALKPEILEDIENWFYTEEEAEDESQVEEPKNIYSWIWVDSYTYDKLRVLKEPVVEIDCNYFWGRTCFGQAYCLDWCIQEIAKKAYPEKYKALLNLAA